MVTEVHLFERYLLPAATMFLGLLAAGLLDEDPVLSKGITGFRRAGELGFEPRQADPESAVLPLHYSPSAPSARGRHSSSGESSRPCCLKWRH